MFDRASGQVGFSFRARGGGLGPVFARPATVQHSQASGTTPEALLRRAPVGLLEDRRDPFYRWAHSCGYQNLVEADGGSRLLCAALQELYSNPETGLAHLFDSNWIGVGQGRTTTSKEGRLSVGFALTEFLPWLNLKDRKLIDYSEHWYESEMTTTRNLTAGVMIEGMPDVQQFRDFRKKIGFVTQRGIIAQYIKRRREAAIKAAAGIT